MCAQGCQKHELTCLYHAAKICTNDSLFEEKKLIIIWLHNCVLDVTVLLTMEGIYLMSLKAEVTSLEKWSKNRYKLGKSCCAIDCTKRCNKKYFYRLLKQTNGGSFMFKLEYNLHECSLLKKRPLCY